MADISKISNGTNTYDIKDVTARTELSNKQDTLISGTNIKTINNQSILGDGNLTIDSSVNIDEKTITSNSDNELQVIAVKNIRDNSTLPIWQGTEQQWNQGEATTWHYWQTSETAMWQSEGSLPSSASWWLVTYGDGKFVAVASGPSDKAAYSTDGINWTASTMPSSANWVSVTYGDDKFVAVANNSYKAAYSTDGINWTASTMPSSEYWSSVTYGNGKFVAVTEHASNKAAYSTDGINWTASTLPGLGYWNSVTYGDGKFITVEGNSSNLFAYSTDGINWTASTLPSYTDWSSVTYGNGKFVAVAFYDYNALKSTYSLTNKTAYSTDGRNWTASTLPSYASWKVTYGDGKFVAVATNMFTSSSDKSAYSTDGINWIASTMPSSANWRSVTYGDGKFVAVAANIVDTAIFTMSYDKCYTLDQIPTTSSQVYSAPETTSTKTITSIGSGTIILSDNLIYNSTPSGNQFTYRTIGDAHPDWLSNINNVGVKIGNTTIATTASLATVATSGSYNDLINKPTIPDTTNMQTTNNLVTSVSSSSTDSQYPSAKLFYDTLGDLESAINIIRGV